MCRCGSCVRDCRCRWEREFKSDSECFAHTAHVVQSNLADASLCVWKRLRLKHAIRWCEPCTQNDGANLYNTMCSLMNNLAGFVSDPCRARAARAQHYAAELKAETSKSKVPLISLIMEDVRLAVCRSRVTCWSAQFPHVLYLYYVYVPMLGIYYAYMMM